MLFSEDVFVKLTIFALGMCGFMVAKHIRNHKTKNAPLVCMVGFDCHAVVHSDYSKFFGIPVEIFGMMYYAFISLAYLFFAFVPNAMQTNVVVVFSLSSLIAFLFSIYLICVQIFILKKGCSWCFVSAFISILIFVLIVLNYDFGFIMEIISK